MKLSEIYVTESGGHSGESHSVVGAEGASCHDICGIESLRQKDRAGQ